MADLLELIIGQIIGNISTVLVGVLLYYNFLLFEDYFRLIVWAFLLSQALRGAKENVVNLLKSLSEDPEDLTRRRGRLLRLMSQQLQNFHLQKKTASFRTFLLDNGIFLFALFGAVSIWLRFYHWISIVHLLIAAASLLIGALWLFDRRIFYYRHLISDEVLVATCLIIGFFTTGVFVVIYLGTESYMEGSRAATDVSNWVQTRVINDERTRQLFSEQVANGKVMIESAMHSVEKNYNGTMWWPSVKILMNSLYDTSSSSSASQNVSTLYNMSITEAFFFAREKFDSFNWTSTDVTNWSSKGLEYSSFAFGSVSHIVIFVLSALVAFVSLGIRAVFFVTSLFYLLCTSWDPLERFVNDLLPVEPAKKPAVLRSLRRVIEGAFFLPLKISSLHALVTLTCFNFMNVEFIFLATLITFMVSIMPIVPPYLVCVPWALTICMTSSFLKGLTLFLLHYCAFTVIDEALYVKSLGAISSYVSALSVVFGVYVFGMEGVIFGPLLVCGVKFAYEVSNHGIQAAADFTPQATKKTNMNKTPSSHKRKLKDNFPPPVQNSPIIQNKQNIFSNAYRAFSGKESFGLNNLRNRFLSVDFGTNNNNGENIMMNLVVELHHVRRVRFVALSTWSFDEFKDALRTTLRIKQLIEGVYTEDGMEILSVRHIHPHETLFVRLHSPILSLNKKPRSIAKTTIKQRSFSADQTYDDILLKKNEKPSYMAAMLFGNVQAMIAKNPCEKELNQERENEVGVVGKERRDDERNIEIEESNEVEMHEDDEEEKAPSSNGVVVCNGAKLMSSYSFSPQLLIGSNDRDNVIRRDEPERQFLTRKSTSEVYQVEDKTTGVRKRRKKRQETRNSLPASFPIKKKESTWRKLLSFNK